MPETEPTQLTLTCSKPTIETPEKGVKYVSIVDFELVNISWVRPLFK